MKRESSSFVCQECGYESTQWLGKCPECGQWNTFKEFKNKKLRKNTIEASLDIDLNSNPKTFNQIEDTEKTRLQTGFSEMDGVLGGGIVAGSVILLAGDPGIGKSTLLLQMCIGVSQQEKKVLYISGEESVEQIKMRAARLTDTAGVTHLLLLSIANLDKISQVIQEMRPELVIIDSIQTMESEEAGGLSG